MMRLSLIVALLAFHVGVSQAGVITFDSLTGSNGDPFATLVDSGFSVNSIQGDWLEAHVSGNAAPSIFSRSDDAAIEVVGGLFTFSGLDTNDGGIASGISSATYQFEGFLNNVSVLLSSGTISPQYEMNASPNSSTVLDRLVVSINRGNTSSYNIDNIVVDRAAPAVPEPGSLAIFGIGCLTMIGFRRKQMVAKS